METGSPDRISPTVTREKWASHARSKLLNGYVLIIGKERRNANFFKPSKGYEVCPYKIARRLVEEGIVEPTEKQHYLGTVYVLSANAAVLASPPAPSVDDDDEDTPAGEMDDLLVEITDEEEEESEEALDPEDLADEPDEEDDRF
ncbi:MAG: hypothetical protein KatS3mg043_0276 [Rhodothermaceae bacterium]|nr:MAG: hypothetical protein KatS3mg043_0276 [Rhodothermaceae bacterium]